MSTGGWENYFWIGNVVLGNNTSPQAVASSTNPQYCISGSIAADGTITMPSSWSFDYTNGIKTDEMLLFGYWPKWESADLGPKLTDSGLPIQASALSNTFGFTYTDKLSTSAGSNYDLLIDTYFTATQTETSLSDITLNISINDECGNASGSIACYTPNPQGSVVINGITYDIGYSPATSTAATHLEFNSNYATHYSGTVSLKPFVDWAVTHGYMPATTYLQRMSISHEIYSGSGSSNMTVKINQ
jgi:hypothetical protein